MILYQTLPLFKAKVIKRPSASIKSPYVADILLVDDNNEPLDDVLYLAHSPSLGCCGLADKDAYVMVSKSNNPKTKTDYVIELSCFYETKKEINYLEYVSLKPKIAEKVAHQALLQNGVPGIPQFKSLNAEKKFKQSRFDFYGIDQFDQEHIIEIKTVPLAYYVDVPKKEYKNYQEIINNSNFNDKIAYFPDGYRKNMNEPVSPRALKHIQELEEIALEGKIKCTLLFVIQRSDICCFQPSNLDKIYKKAVQKAWINGVQIKTIGMKWNELGEGILFKTDLPIHLFEFNGPFVIEDLN